MRPSSDVSWRMLASARPKTTKPASASAAIRSAAPTPLSAAAIRVASAPPTESIQPTPRARGWRMNSKTEKTTSASQRWPWWYSAR